MIDLRPVLRMIGLMLTLLGVSMALPMAADLWVGAGEWRLFAGCGAFSLFCGQGLVFANHHQRLARMSLPQSLLTPVLGWVVAAMMAAVPFALGSAALSPTDALFEAVSGVTATGASVMTDLATRTPGTLLWRSLLQWLCGGAALTMGILVLPSLRVGGMELFRFDPRGGEDGAIARPTRILLRALGLYAVLTVLIGLLLWAAGMSGQDALNHALTTLSCGGFSTADESIGHWHRAAVEWVVLFGMLLGGAPFLVHLQILSRQWRQALAHSQLRCYLALILLCGLTIAGWLLVTHPMPPGRALRQGLFAAASVMTGTGFATADQGHWLGLPSALLLLLAMIGGCAGSAAGGIKVFRLQILWSNAVDQVIRLLWPNGVRPPVYEGRVVDEPIIEAVLGYLFLFIVSMMVLSLGLALTGLDFATSLSSAAAALANLGPGLTPVAGPTADDTVLIDLAKWQLTAGMLFGRLELFLPLVLFNKGFWRR